MYRISRDNNELIKYNMPNDKLRRYGPAAEIRHHDNSGSLSAVRHRFELCRESVTPYPDSNTNT